MDLVRGAQHLHGLNIVHRDIKPANLLIFWTEELGLHGKLGDYRLSRGDFLPVLFRGDRADAKFLQSKASAVNTHRCTLGRVYNSF